MGPQVSVPDSFRMVESSGNYGSKYASRSYGPKRTDIFAIICFASGMFSLMLLPLVMVPICYVSAIISYYRLREDPNLKGQWLRIVGAICGACSMLYLMWLFEIGPFR